MLSEVVSTVFLLHHHILVYRILHQTDFKLMQTAGNIQIEFEIAGYRRVETDILFPLLLAHNEKLCL